MTADQLRWTVQRGDNDMGHGDVSQGSAFDSQLSPEVEIESVNAGSTELTDASGTLDLSELPCLLVDGKIPRHPRHPRRPLRVGAVLRLTLVGAAKVACVRSDFCFNHDGRH